MLDRLCASHKYSEAIVCERRRAEAEQTALQLAVVLQNSYHGVTGEPQEEFDADDHLPSKKPPSSSPTAVQRLAALSAGSLSHAHSAGTGSAKRRLQRLKKVRTTFMSGATG